MEDLASKCSLPPFGKLRLRILWTFVFMLCFVVPKSPVSTCSEVMERSHRSIPASQWPGQQAVSQRLWERHCAGKVLACGFRLPHGGSAVWLWDYLVEFCSSQVPSVCGPWGNLQACVVWQESTTFLTGELASQGVPFSSSPSPHCRPLLPIWGVPTEPHTLSRLTCVAHLHPEPPPSLQIQATGC